MNEHILSGVTYGWQCVKFFYQLMSSHSFIRRFG